MVLEGLGSWNREHQTDGRTDGEKQGNKSEKRGRGRRLEVRRTERKGEMMRGLREEGDLECVASSWLNSSILCWGVVDAVLKYTGATLLCQNQAILHTWLLYREAQCAALTSALTTNPALTAWVNCSWKWQQIRGTQVHRAYPALQAHCEFVTASSHAVQVLYLNFLEQSELCKRINLPTGTDPKYTAEVEAEPKLQLNGV
ncbi:hypothetical protein NQZ68_039924 [Dissostichus eleginoides]|nr:hypothetical protein NQZ68_039924 [Dissostichus eleginoides]